MKAKELIEILSQHPDKEILIWVASLEDPIELQPNLIEIIEPDPNNNSYQGSINISIDDY